MCKKDQDRYFEYMDGTPFFLLAATNWAINTSRCGLGNNQDGPFYQYLKDRKSKQFSTILTSYLRGFGDVENINGYRNDFLFINRLITTFIKDDCANYT